MEMFLLSINILSLKTFMLMEICTFTYEGQYQLSRGHYSFTHSDFIHLSKLSTFSGKEGIHFYFFRYILLKKETQQELFFYIMIKDFYYLSLFHQFHIITENVIVQRCSMSPHCLIISLGVLVTYICTIWFLFFLYIFCEVG